MTEENDRRDVADVDINAGLEKLRLAQQMPDTEPGTPTQAPHPKYEAVTDLTEGLARTLLKMQEDLELALGRITYIEDYYCEDCNCDR